MTANLGYRGSDNNQPPRDIALNYLQRGWQPVPVPYGYKRPVLEGWPRLTITERNVAEYFDQRRMNIGVKLGSQSNGLTDVDLDCEQAIELADVLLPPTSAVFGRQSRPRSHRLYLTNLCETEHTARIPFLEPPGLAQDPEKPAMLVELRIGGGDRGAQTIFPGSVHESGETIEWDDDGQPAEINGTELKRYVRALGAAVLLVIHYPARGSRQNGALVLGGMLALAGWTSEDIHRFVFAVARTAKDEEADKRSTSAAGAVALLTDRRPTPGLPRMREVWGVEAANAVAGWLGIPQAEAPDNDVSSIRETQTNQLIALADEAELFHSSDGQCYADFYVNGHRETWAITARGGFAQWLRHRFYLATGGAPNSQSLTTALNTLAAKAQYEGRSEDVYVRIVELDDHVYLDLCDEDCGVIEIDATGWRVIADPPVRFLRRRGMLPLPVPELHTPETRRAAIDKLLSYVNVGNDENQVLLVHYLLATLRGRGPFPVLVLVGEPGAAKTTLGRILKSLVDPTKAPDRAAPREIRDLMVAATNSYLIAFDNFSELPDWLSDALCRLSTGGGFGTRQLYTDEDEVLFDITRPVVLNGVDNVVLRGDLTDRTIFLTLLPITPDKRRSELELKAAFDRDRPAILGALLDCVSFGLRELPSVNLTHYPRMADFAKWATACERGGTDALWPVGWFEHAYSTNRANATDTVVEDDLVANAIRRMIEDENLWEGDAAGLLCTLNTFVDEAVQKQKYWPKATNALARRMNKVAGILRKIGINIESSYKDRRRWWTITGPISPLH